MNTKEHWQAVDREFARWMTVGVLAVSFTGLLAMLQVPELDGYLRIATYCFAAALPVAATGSAVHLMRPSPITRLRIVVQLIGLTFSLAGIWATVAHIEYGAAAVFGVGALVAVVVISKVLDAMPDPPAAP